MEKINIVGLGPGHIDFITSEGINAIKRCSLLIGDVRQIDSVKNLMTSQKIYYLEKFSALLELLKAERTEKEITILVSGDTGFYSLLDFIRRNLGDEKLNVIPGISSFQYLFSRLKKCWHDYLLLSLHGRECSYIDLLSMSKKGLILLTDRENTPHKIAEKLTVSGLGNITMTVGENLSYENEKIYSFKARDYKNYSNFSMNIVILEKE